MVSDLLFFVLRDSEKARREKALLLHFITRRFSRCAPAERLEEASS